MIRQAGLYRRSPQVTALETDSVRAVIESLEQRILFSASPASTPAQLVAQANNAFAFAMLQEMNSSSGNLVFSPYSAATALEMALQGAKGNTASEIIKALDLPSSQLSQAGISALYQLFQTNASTAGYTLSTANALWVNQNFSLLQSFVTAEQNTFGAAPNSLDFSNPQAAANTINAWVSAQTNGKIQDLIQPSMLNQLTALVLTNAVYFKGSWTDAFNANLTHAASFNLSSTLSTTVQMMEQTNQLGYYAQGGPNGFQAVDLPYQGNDMDMMVILPNSDDIAGFKSTLNVGVFSQISAGLSDTEVQVDLPKFDLNETSDLIPALEGLGIHDAFGPAADFSGISQQNQTYISTVTQKSFINVDESGTEAAAATGVVVTLSVVTIPPPATVTFNADHPFIVAIRERSTNTILFLGAVANPGDTSAISPSAPNPISHASPASPIFAPAVPVATTSGATLSTIQSRVNPLFAPPSVSTLADGGNDGNLLDSGGVASLLG